MFFILLTILFLRPFISSLTFPYLNMLFSIILLIFLAIWIIIKGLDYRGIRMLHFPLCLLALAILISLISSQNKIVSTNELHKYITGILLLSLCVSLDKEERNKIIICLLGSGLVISLLAIYQYFFGFNRLSMYATEHKITDPFVLDYISRKRVFFPFVTPNILAGYLAMLIPLALCYRKKTLLIIPLALALLLTQSLGGALSLFFGLLVYLFIKGERKKSTIIAAFLLIGFIILAYRSSTVKYHTHPVFSAVMRFGYWKETLGIIKQHPFAGVGLGNFNLPQVRYAHNSYLQIWAEMGILGPISILWIIVLIFKSALHRARPAAKNNQIIILVSASFVFLFHNCFEFTLFLPEVSLLWWAIAGLIISKYANKHDHSYTNL